MQEVVDQEVTALAGERYARKDASIDGRHHGSTPGDDGPGRAARADSRCRGFAASQGARLRSGRPTRCMAMAEVNDLLLTRVLYGISCRNYEAAAEAIPGAIGLSGSTVSRAFI